MNDLRLPSNRSFGIVFFTVFLLISIYPLIKDGNIRIWSSIIALIFLVLGIFNSKLLSLPNQLWFKFGLFLSKFFSPIIMAIVYFLVVTPTGLILRIFRKDTLNLKYSKKNTYWIEKDKNTGTMKDQF